MGGAVPRFAPAYEGCPMPDWQKLVSQVLSGLALDAAEKDEVHAELARIWKISTNRCEQKVYQSKRRFNKRWRKLRTGRICGAKS